MFVLSFSLFVLPRETIIHNLYIFKSNFNRFFVSWKENEIFFCKKINWNKLKRIKQKENQRFCIYALNCFRTFWNWIYSKLLKQKHLQPLNCSYHLSGLFTNYLNLSKSKIYSYPIADYLLEHFICQLLFENVQGMCGHLYSKQRECIIAR